MERKCRGIPGVKCGQPTDRTLCDRCRIAYNRYVAANAKKHAGLKLNLKRNYKS